MIGAIRVIARLLEGFGWASLGFSSLCGSVAIVAVLCNYLPDKAPTPMSVEQMWHLLQKAEALLLDEKQRGELRNEGAPVS